MAFDTPTEKWSEEGNTVAEGGKSATRVFQIASDAPTTDTAVGARLATGIPRYGAPHPDDAFMWVNHISARRISPSFFEVAVRYQSRTSPKDGDNPLDAPPEVEYKPVITDEMVDVDVNGHAITNSIGEPPDPPWQSPVVDIQIVVVRNIANYDGFSAAGYSMTVNQDEWGGLPVGVVRMDSVVSKSVYEGGLSYFEVTGTATVRTRLAPGQLQERAWWRRSLNVGYYHIDPADGKRRRAVDDDGKPMAVPVMLNAAGEQIFDPLLAHYNEHEMLPSVPFAPLGLL